MVRDRLAWRAARKDVARAQAARPALKPDTYEIGVYFADAPINLYQVRQWLAPLAELDKSHRVLLLVRNAASARILFEESPLDIAYVRTVEELETVIAAQPLKIVLYVNQNARNFQMMRYGRRWHVFINHGESDKMYMTTNQFKAYDYSLIAGDAARERLGRVLWDYDFDKRALPIGRPQADHYTGTIPFTPDDREVVLYAPTWEGDRAAAAYGSIATHGVELVSQLVATGKHRVIYRPHPRSGALNSAYGAANKKIQDVLEQANRKDASAQHVIDLGPELGWQLAVADIAIVDISAMVYDRLAAGKPLLITRPVDPGAEIDEGGYLGDCEWLAVADARNIVARIDELEHDPKALKKLEKWSRHYFGDTSPGAPTQRFHKAIEDLLSAWQTHAKRHARDAVVDITEHEEGEED